jgi:hypothetical protein
MKVADIYLALKSVKAAKLPRLGTGVIPNYSLAENRGRKIADNLSIVPSVTFRVAISSFSKPQKGQHLTFETRRHRQLFVQRRGRHLKRQCINWHFVRRSAQRLARPGCQ